MRTAILAFIAAGVLCAGVCTNWFTVTPPDFATNFTWSNQNTASYSTVNGIPVLQVPYQSTAQWNNLLRAVPGSTYTITMTFIPSAAGYGSWQYGLTVEDNTTKAAHFVLNMFNTPGQLAVYHETTGTTVGTETTPCGPTTVPVAQIRALRIVEDGTHRTFQYSADGGTAWAQYCQEATNAFMTPTKYGVTMFNNASAVANTYASVLRLEGTTP